MSNMANVRATAVLESCRLLLDDRCSVPQRNSVDPEQIWVGVTASVSPAALGPKRQHELRGIVSMVSIYVSLFSPSDAVLVDSGIEAGLLWRSTVDGTSFADVVAVGSPAASIWTGVTQRGVRAMYTDCVDRFDGFRGVRVIQATAPTRSLLVCSSTGPPTLLADSPLWPSWLPVAGLEGLR